MSSRNKYAPAPIILPRTTTWTPERVASLPQVLDVRQLLAKFKADQPACLLGTLKKDNPAGLGRIVRGADGEFLGIVEEKDATPEQRRINEVNMSTYLFEERYFKSDFGRGATISILMLLIVAVLSVFYVRKMVQIGAEE